MAPPSPEPQPSVAPGSGMREFEMPGVDRFKTFFWQDFENGEGACFQNLKIPKCHAPSIQNELILS